MKTIKLLMVNYRSMFQWQSSVLCTFILLIISFQSNVNAQIKLAVHTQYGYSNFIEINREPYTRIANYYTKLPSYAIGGETILPFKDSLFFIASGINFLSLAARNNIPAEFITPETNPTNWVERFYSIAVPIKVYVPFLEKWILLHVGVSNAFHLNKPKTMWDKNINYYTLSFTGGIDFCIKKRMLVGIAYYREIIPTVKSLIATDVSYFYKATTIKIGYVIN